jgi:hypothetical protein
MIESRKTHLKPIADILGLAVLDSQRLEYSIAFIMLLVNKQFSFNTKEHDDLIDEYMLNLSSLTLGNLMNQLKQLIEIDNNSKVALENALDARNYLMHRFLNSQQEKLLTIKGRKEALELVKVKRQIIFNCYAFLDPIIQQLMILRGMNPEEIIKSVSSKYEKE